ncbi:MAG: hypothetical protein HOP29_10000 [Phycisphaerales bacterium]|nr:hypothetical protein [Phycisphaerales bacterium]
MNRRSIKTVLLAAGASAFVGCATATHEDLAAFIKAHEHVIAATELRVSPGDGLQINAPRVFEIDGERPRVLPDGKISLRLLGEVKVSGMTAREISLKLEEALLPYYREPIVHVRIVNQPREVYYVLGQVAGEGPYAFTGRDSLMHALAVARPNHIAWQSKVKVIRPDPVEDKRHEFEVDVDAMIKTGDTRKNVLLQPGDVVYVPPTPLGWVGLRIRELLDPIAPAVQAYATPGDFIDENNQYEARRVQSSAR